MTPERWQQIKEVLGNALELDPSQRGAYLATACAGDPTLRAEVEPLMAAEQGAGTDLLRATCAEDGSTFLADTDPKIGHPIGPYKIVEPIGRGGMGVVYRAFRADDQYQKQVAIKLVRTGQDSAFVVSRFRNERQILASLDHPNIARLLDGGATENGIPYLVMELVEGLPIDAYCDNHKLSTTERLRLLQQVCSAVQYAHQRLIIHRDLKPSNMLVTAEGVPKLLDFGIAKVLDPRAFGGNVESTMTLFRVLTPGYASPEQVRGEPITTASDVYSLGVILYEVLTGCSPYGRRNLPSDEITRLVCEFEPERPSTVITRAIARDSGDAVTPEQVSLLRDGSVARLRKRLRGDIDNIVLMALRKEPQRRYSSVELLAADVSRHLENLPVLARGDSARYRAGKFVIRHKAVVAAGIAVALALLLGLAATLREARIARTQRARAEQRFKDVRELANSDLFELHDAIRKLPGSASVRNMVVQRALKYLEKLSRDAAGDRELLHELAAGYERIAALQGSFSGPGIGDTAAALGSYEKALALRESLVANSKGDHSERMAEVKLMGAYVQTLELAGRTGDASRVAKRAVAIIDEAINEQAGDVSAQLAAAYANLQLALVLAGNGSSSTTREIPEAIKHDQETLRILEPLTARNEDARAFYAKAKLLLAFHLSKERRFVESEQTFNDALSAEESRPSPSPTYLEDLYSDRGIMFERSDNQVKALADHENCEKIAESLVVASPDDLNQQVRVQIARAHIAVQTFRLGKGADIQALDSAINNGERMFAANPSQLFYRNLLAGGYYYQAEFALLQRKYSDAAKLYTKSLDMANSIAQSDADDLESHVSIAKIKDALGVVASEAGQPGDAQQQFDSARQSLRDLLQIRPHDAEALYVSDLVEAHSTELQSCSQSGNCGSARWRLPPPLN